MARNVDFGYVPGDWWVLSHPNGMAILHHSFSLNTVEGLWNDISRQRSLVTWLSRIVDGEFAKLGDFGMARFNGETVELVLRGDVVAHVNGNELDAQAKLTWREETLTASNLRLVGTSNSQRTLPTLGGVAFGDELTWTRSGDALDVPGIVAISADTADEAHYEEPEEHVAPAPVIPEMSNVEETWAVAPGDDLAAASFQGSGPIETAGSDQLAVVLPDGLMVELHQPALIGRAPEPPIGRADEFQVIVVESPQHDVSRTHVEVRGDGDMAVVTDQRSINGTIVIEPGKSPRRLHAGEGVSVPAGTQIDIGDGIIMTVTAR